MAAKTRFHTARQLIALATAVSLMLPSVEVVLVAQSSTAKPPATTQSTAKPPAPSTAKPPATPPTAKPPATQASTAKPAAPAPSDAVVDGGWPRAYLTAAGGQLVIYQPQVATWERQKDMLAYAAVSYLMKGATRPELGTVTLEADTDVALDERLVKFTNIRVTESSFPKLSREQVRDITDTIVGGIPDAERVIALDRVMAMVDKSQIRPSNVEGVKSDPPTIFYSTSPAVLVNIDGDAIWSPIPSNDLKYAVNTNWDLFEHEPTKTYFLRHEKVWLKASTLKGPWTAAGTLPGSFSKLPADENWKEVKSALPGTKTSSAPAVFVSTTPAEMILVQGAPIYTTVTGASPLMWLQNTESDVFRFGSTGDVYYLVAGRWFSASSLLGPWTFATEKLPDVFKQIPLEHPRSRVLASVPGTPEAADAILLAQVPQTARVNRKQTQAPEVTYQGEPQFEPIPTTTVSRATNTDKDIIKVGDLYYMCFQGVWFMARSANGPWEVATSVPEAIYKIPASSPSHNVTYVTVVEDDDDDEWVTYAAVAGYTGMMVAYGCVVWGSGWYYPPYVGYGGFYPVYYPFYPTYGFSAWYNPWTGAYGRSAAVYGPYGGMGASARYNPRTGTYSRSAVAWGPYGARGVGQAYNPRTGTYARTSQGSGVYGSWGATSVQRGDQWAQTARVTNRVTGTTTRVTQGSGGGEAITRRGPGADSGVVRTGSGDVYAGRDGNVYRRDEGGGWSKHENGSWGSAERPTPSGDRAATAGTTDRGTTAGSGDTVGQLNRDSAARSEGSTRTRDYGSVRSSGGSTPRSGGTSRPSGGGFRGGGGRRR
ncbi:MAG TPA: hypothetical protein VFP16_05575 [Vicinamibacterales bacterium]|nr:hypothetical protein [Vicinamibacterales bacterium]